jgi:hypothetical protein
MRTKVAQDKNFKPVKREINSRKMKWNEDKGKTINFREKKKKRVEKICADNDRFDADKEK